MLDTIAFDLRVEAEPQTQTPARDPRKFTAMVVYEGDEQWSAVCTELDIATVGATPENALSRLTAAVRDALDLAADRKLSPGSPVPNLAQAELLASHQPGHGPAAIIHFSV